MALRVAKGEWRDCGAHHAVYLIGGTVFATVTHNAGTQYPDHRWTAYLAHFEGPDFHLDVETAKRLIVARLERELEAVRPAFEVAP